VKRYKIVVEFITDHELDGTETLADIAREMNEGQDIGGFTVTEEQDITKREAYDFELEHGGDGTFMHSDGWKYGLRQGDQALVLLSDESVVVTIQSITWKDDITYSMVTVDGNHIEGHIDDLDASSVID